MKAITTAGYVKPASIAAGPRPELKYLPIADLVTDPTYKRPLSGRGKWRVLRISQTFSWSCFSAVVVTPLGNGKYAIIDGRRRATAAALAGFEEVPCQIVQADRAQQELAAKVINRTVIGSSRLGLQAAGHLANDPPAMRIAEVCALAGVELLRYPVAADRQAAGQTMALGAIAQCLKRYGEETVITALQCVTQTANNKPGALSARTIKALCAVLGSDRLLRDSGLTLLEIFDGIDLLALVESCDLDTSAKGASAANALAGRIRGEITRLTAAKSKKSVRDVAGGLTQKGLSFVAGGNRGVVSKPGPGAGASRANRTSRHFLES